VLIWLGDERRKALKCGHAGRERPVLLKSKTHERDKAVQVARFRQGHGVVKMADSTSLISCDSLEAYQTSRPNARRGSGGEMGVR
jgi:hypothetical protein